MAGSIDGIHLDRFEMGQVYDVGTAVGSYLLAIGVAEPEADEGSPAIVSAVRWEGTERRIAFTPPKKSNS